MSGRQPPAQFMVAFSFAGEQRSLVKSVASEVARQVGETNVFYDAWWEHYLAGGDADLKLQSVYEQAALVVVCVSQEYGDKAWTRTENSVIRARLMKAQAALSDADKLGVLPVRVGDGEIEGVPYNTIAPDIRERTPVQAADLILDRLDLVSGESDGTATREGLRTHRVRLGDSLDLLAFEYLGDPTEWRRLATANRVVDPMALVPGQLLLLPDRAVVDG